MKLILISCSAGKLSQPAPARALYNSQLFNLAKRYAIANGDAWGILSAKHGLVWPDQVVAPYDQRIPKGRDARRALMFRINSTFSCWLSDNRRELFDGMKWSEALQTMVGGSMQWDRLSIEVLAGQDYVRTLPDRIQKRAAYPLDGLQVGERLSWLSKSLRGEEVVA